MEALMLSRLWVLWVALALTAGCIGEDLDGAPAGGAAGGKADGIDSERASAHIRGDSRVEGALEVGTTSVSYAGDPAFLVYELEAQRGDVLVVSATATEAGDPVLWLLDPDYSILAKNDDESSYSTDSEIHYRVQQGGQLLVAITELFRDEATFELTLRGASEPDEADLGAFLALPPEEQMDLLYRNHEHGDWYDGLDLEAGFSRVSDFMLRDELDEPLRSAMLDAYFELRDESRAEGGTSPWVNAVLRGGLVYAIEMETVENNEDCEWGYVRVFDASGERIGEHGHLGY